MKRLPRTALAGLGLRPLILAALLLSGCGWLPERFAVNADILHMLGLRSAEAPDAGTVAGRMRVPEGYSVGIFAEGLSNVRVLRFTANGDLLASQPRVGRVALLSPDRDGDGRSDEVRELLGELERPYGLDVHAGHLYIGLGNAVVRAPFDAAAGRVTGPVETVVPELPEGGNHWTRNLRIGPDGWMYVSVGSSCNVCIEEDSRRAAMLRFRPDGSHYELYARGLRNAVGFDWRPGTDELYATDNGRDLLGDNFPPCELNRVERAGDYGWPYANGARVPDPDFGEGEQARIAASIPPAHGFRAHNAPLGIAFVSQPKAPAEYQGAALVALHGSWNRTVKDGYKVVSLHWSASGEIEERDLLTGFELDDDLIGRPAHVAVGPDGAFYVSDDYAGVIYRVARGSGSGSGVLSRTSADPAAALSAVPVAERRVRAQRGRALYEVNGCAGCHESEHALQGVVAVELGGLSSRYDVDSLTAFMDAPTPPMPRFDLDESERRDLAVHLLASELASD